MLPLSSIAAECVEATDPESETATEMFAQDIKYLYFDGSWMISLPAASLTL
jgi:hypothetical protein